MKFVCLQEPLTQKLNLVSRTVAPKSTLSILSNIKMVASDNQLRLTATNLSWGVTTRLGVEVEKEGGITVPGALLSSFVNNLPAQKLIFQLSKGSLKVETSLGSSTLRGVGPEDFPPVLEEGFTPEVTFQSSQLRQALSGVTFAAALDESRPILTGILLQIKSNRAKLVGVDGFRLSEYTMTLKEPSSEDFSLVLPARSLAELTRLSSGEKEVRFSLSTDRSQAVFEIGETVLSSRLLEGDFPAYEQIIPKDFNTVVRLPLADFRQAIKVSSLFTEGATNVVRLDIRGDESKLLVGATAKEVGSNEMNLTSEIQGENNQIAFNGKFLNDALNFLEELAGGEKNPQMELRVKDAVSPGYLCYPPCGEFLHIIMPVRVQD